MKTLDDNKIIFDFPKCHPKTIETNFNNKFSVDGSFEEEKEQDLKFENGKNRKRISKIKKKKNITIIDNQSRLRQFRDMMRRSKSVKGMAGIYAKAYKIRMENMRRNQD